MDTNPNIVQTSSRDFIAAVKRAVNQALRASRIDNVIMGIAGPLFNWGQRNSLFPLHFGIKCCALEFAAAFAPRFDAERFGVVARSSPRQCDLLIVNGPVTKKVKAALFTLYDQMPEPKWVIAMGECAIDGGPYYDTYGIIRGVDKIMPVDVYIPGCPPRPEAMLAGVLKLQRKIKKYHKQKVGLD